MSLEIGIVGLPNAGKSTLFNALTRAGAATASYAFTTIEPNVGVVAVADPRLDRLAEIVEPDEVIPTAIRFVDIAGLVEGAHRGEGLGNQFLGHIRAVDAVAMVVRCFEAEDVVHPMLELDPVRDIEVVDTELLLADLAAVERRTDKVRNSAKGRPQEVADELAWLEALASALGEGRPARGLISDEREQGWAAEMSLLTAKPRLYVANVAEETDATDPRAQAVAEYAAQEGAGCVVLSARLEADLVEFDDEEAALLRDETAWPEPGLPRLAHAGLRLLDLVTFFTTTGGRIVQAWTVRRGTKAPGAAGAIHTDFEQDFIRAEVVAYDDLDAAGTLATVRERGQLRLEGRDYEVADGDVIHFRFNV